MPVSLVTGQKYKTPAKQGLFHIGKIVKAFHLWVSHAPRTSRRHV
jgi:hypothetical protein